MCTKWHTKKNGLCFYRLPSGYLCDNLAVRELTDAEGNGYGIYCYKHLELARKEYMVVEVLEKMNV
jgi:hypothetical protein